MTTNRQLLRVSPISDEMMGALARQVAISQRVRDVERAYETWRHLQTLKGERWVKSVLKAWAVRGAAQ